MITKDVLRDWFRYGVGEQAMFLLVICDTFSWEDYPVLAFSVAEAKDKHYKYLTGSNMTQVMEIYDLRKDMEEQINKVRNFAEIE